MSLSYCSLEMTFTSAPVSTLQLMGKVCVSEGFAVTWIWVITLVRFFLCSIPAVVGVLGLAFKGALCSASNVPRKTLSGHSLVAPSGRSSCSVMTSFFVLDLQTLLK